jgi:hypothetical protein
MPWPWADRWVLISTDTHLGKREIFQLAAQRHHQQIDSGFALHCQTQVLLAGTNLIATFTHHQPIVFEQTIAQLSS